MVTGPPPNNGDGFDKDLSGNELPNAPPFTASFGAQYTMPVTPDWAGTLRGDYYWQDYSWARIFNDNPYDRLRGYTNVNLTLIFTNQNGWQVMLYDKNVFNVTAITGDFLNSDDSGSDDQCLPDRSEVDRHSCHEELVRGKPMSELMNPRNSERNFRWHAGLRIGAGFACCVCRIKPMPRLPIKSDRPTVWIELGGQLSR